MNDLTRPIDDGRCIGCGPQAANGLHMKFTTRPDGSVESLLDVPAAFQGWRGVVHGGIVALLLDEAMAYAAGSRGVLGVTAELKLRFRKPVPTDRPLVVRGTVTWQRRTVLGVTASVSDDAALLASAEGRFVSRGTLAPGERFGELDAR
jgi:uncharacterized protein (TIGR00369 family)